MCMSNIRYLSVMFQMFRLRLKFFFCCRHNQIQTRNTQVQYLSHLEGFEYYIKAIHKKMLVCCNTTDSLKYQRQQEQRKRCNIRPTGELRGK